MLKTFTNQVGRTLGPSMARHCGSILADGKWISLDEYIDLHLEFTDRESYIEWVTKWKLEYKAVSTASRFAKRLRKKINAEQAGVSQQSMIELVKTLRDQAFCLLLVRKAGKLKSANLYNIVTV